MQAAIISVLLTPPTIEDIDIDQPIDRCEGLWS
jgi:hypothetical protein